MTGRNLKKLTSFKTLRVSGRPVGTPFAFYPGMTPFPNPRSRAVAKVQWMHRLFVKGGMALSCDVNACGDGMFAATLFPLWAPEDQVTEMFMRPAEASQWHAQMSQRLQEGGWLLVEGCAVTSAA